MNDGIEFQNLFVKFGETHFRAVVLEWAARVGLVPSEKMQQVESYIKKLEISGSEFQILDEIRINVDPGGAS